MSDVHVNVGAGKEKIYHTAQCDRFPEDSRLRDQEELEAWGWRECKYCSGEFEYSTPRTPLRRMID